MAAMTSTQRTPQPQLYANANASAGEGTDGTIVLRPTQKRPGYVLVMTLGLLVLSASLLVAVGRAAERRTVAARLAADELQHRWGEISCRTAVLPHAEQILLAEEKRTATPTPVLKAFLVLGSETIRLTIADEHAKANVNLLFDRTDRAGAEDRLRLGLGSSPLVQRVLLRPVEDAGKPATRPAAGIARPPVPQWVSSFGQVFDNVPPESLSAVAGGVRVSDMLTCWGGGRLNIRRMSPAALRMAAGGNLSGIDQDRLLSARNTYFSGKPLLTAPNASRVNDPAIRIAQSAGLSSGGKPLVGLDKLPPLTVESKCHSLWLKTSDGRRTWHTLSIHDESDKDRPKTTKVSW